MNPETKIENKAVEEVFRYLGVRSIKLKALGENGFPDRLYWLPGGKPFLVEYKVPGGTLQPIQEHIIEWLRELNYDIEVHDDPATTLQACIDRLETAQLPKESRKILARARRRCAVLRSRAR